MTMFIKLESGAPVGSAIVEENFRQLFPNTSFPRFFTADDVEPLGYGIYDFSSQPEPGKYKKVVEVAPVRSDVGIWRQTWAVVDMNDEEKAAEDERKAGEVRNERNTKLSATDWTQVADAPVDKQAWAIYRQALRDITAQAGFPWNVTWPAQPE